MTDPARSHSDCTFSASLRNIFFSNERTLKIGRWEATKASSICHETSLRICQLQRPSKRYDRGSSLRAILSGTHPWCPCRSRTRSTFPPTRRPGSKKPRNPRVLPEKGFASAPPHPNNELSNPTSAAESVMGMLSWLKRTSLNPKSSQ